MQHPLPAKVGTNFADKWQSLGQYSWPSSESQRMGNEEAAVFSPIQGLGREVLFRRRC
jgi:hypothetical protein